MANYHYHYHCIFLTKKEYHNSIFKQDGNASKNTNNANYQNFNLMPRKYAKPTAKHKMKAQANKMARAETGDTDRVSMDKFTNPVRTFACTH